MSPLVVVLKKELTDALRDLRSVLSLLLFPLVGPLLTSLLLTQAVERATAEPHFELYVLGRAHAPGLIAYLAREGVTVREAPDEVEALVHARRADVVLVVPAQFAAAFRDGRPARLELVFDAAREDAEPAVRHTRSLLRRYANSVGSLRLLARGVAADLAQPIVIDEVDLSTPERRAAGLLNLLPMFVLLAAFIGGMYTATDATAGERERGSLEPLLLTAVKRRTLVLGKWLAATLFAAVTVALTLAASLFGLSRVPLERFGMALTLTPGIVALMLLAALTLAPLATALQIAVASFAKSYKEAQTYLSLMVFLPMLPGLVLSLSPAKSEPWMALVPVLGQQVLLMDLLAGEGVDVARLGLATGAVAVLAGLLLSCAAWLFRRERIVFGR